MDFENSAGSNNPQAKDDKDYQAEMLLSAMYLITRKPPIL